VLNTLQRERGQIGSWTLLAFFLSSLDNLDNLNNLHLSTSAWNCSPKIERLHRPSKPHFHLDVLIIYRQSSTQPTNPNLHSTLAPPNKKRHAFLRRSNASQTRRWVQLYHTRLQWLLLLVLLTSMFTLFPRFLLLVYPYLGRRTTPL